MGQFFIFHASQGKDLNGIALGTIKIYGAGNVTPRFEQRFTIASVFSSVASGESNFNFSQPLPDLNHPTHGVEIFLVKIQRNGPAPAATATFRMRILLNGGIVKTLSLNQFFPAQNSSTNFVSFAAAGWHWISGEITVQSSGWSNKCDIIATGSGIVDSVERFFQTTSVPSISSFQLGSAAVGNFWIDPTDELIHYIDHIQIEHTIAKLSGSGSAPGAVDGQIWIDSLAPRINYTVNGRKFTGRTGIRELISRQQSNKTPGFIHVTSLGANRSYWIQMIGADGKNYIVSDGRDT